MELMPKLAKKYDHTIMTVPPYHAVRSLFARIDASSDAPKSGRLLSFDSFQGSMLGVERRSVLPGRRIDMLCDPWTS